MGFVKTFRVFVPGHYEPQTLTGFRHRHSDDLKKHTHLIGGVSEYVDWVWDLFTLKGDHYHRMEPPKEVR